MKYLMLKHYRGPKTHLYTPGDQWTSAEWDAHVQYMSDFADRLRETGEFVTESALAMDGVWVRSDGAGRPPVTEGPFAETKDLIAGFMMIDVESYERALELAAELSAAPGAGGVPIQEWLELRPVMGSTPMTAE
ncbi:MAG TPA: YciI family protein [Thermomicrobiales bacterium]|nr:YciI family protein [Thermomicrobiales bacterium]